MWYLMAPFAAINIITGIDAAFGIGWPGLWDRLPLVSAAASSLPPAIVLWKLAPGLRRPRRPGSAAGRASVNIS
jgi:hypothetical protein